MDATREPGHGPAHALAYLCVPWSVEEYPGRTQFLSDLCGVKRRTAQDWFYRPHRIGAPYLRRFHTFALAQLAAWAAFVEEVGLLADEAERRSKLPRGAIKLRAAARAGEKRSG